MAALVIGAAAAFTLSKKTSSAPASPPVPCLEVRDASSGRVYGAWPLGEGEGFSLEFIDSVNQSPVREIFRSEGPLIRPVALRFSSFGAGMPSTLEEGQELGRDGDALVITGFKEPFPELDYVAGAPADHLLLVGGEAVNLGDLCGRNTRIKILIK